MYHASMLKKRIPMAQDLRRPAQISLSVHLTTKKSMQAADLMAGSVYLRMIPLTTRLTELMVLVFQTALVRFQVFMELAALPQLPQLTAFSIFKLGKSSKA
jgi:hypothetical protein